ncbi:MAG: hypothetical protein NC102_10555 [Clostridium sp.]|nr:hypothetical protein [Clostridium sp.]
MKKNLLAVLIAMLSALSCAAYETVKSETLKVWLDDVTLTADGKTVTHMTLYMNDPAHTYSAFNMEFTIPKGVTVATVKKGRETVDDIFYTDRGTSSHMIACNILPDGVTLKVIGYSMTAEDLFNDDIDGNPLDALFTIGLIASPETENGEHKIPMEGVKFVYNPGDACLPMEEPIFSTMTIQGGTSGIDEIHEDVNGEDADCYDMLGRNMGKNPEPGLYIRKGKKIIVK